MSIPLRYGTTSNIFQVSISLQCQFLLGTVQHYKIESINNNYRSLCKCQFLLGTVQRLPKLLLFFLVAMNVSIPLRYGTTQTRPTVTIKNEIILCQFLLGTVQQQSFPTIIDIILYFFQKFNHFSFKKSVDLFSCLTLIISI